MIKNNFTGQKITNDSCLDNRPIERCSVLVPDIFKIICHHSGIECLGRLSGVSREWYVMSSDDDIWKRFANEFKVVAPHIKSKIGNSLTSLDQIYHVIHTKMWHKKDADFFCKFVKILFDGNVREIKAENGKGQSLDEWYREHKFTLSLRNTKQVYFNNSEFKNIRIPEKVSFVVGSSGLYFKGQICSPFQYALNNPIIINCSLTRLSTRSVESIWINTGGDLRATFDKENKIFGNKREIISTTPELTEKFLDSVWWDRDCYGS